MRHLTAILRCAIGIKYAAACLSVVFAVCCSVTTTKAQQYRFDS